MTTLGCRDFLVDWSRFGTRATVRRFLGDSAWGEGDRATRAGREVAQSVIETWYRKE